MYLTFRFNLIEIIKTDRYNIKHKLLMYRLTQIINKR